MRYTDEMKKTVAAHISAMLDNNVVRGQGTERFEDWCEGGASFDVLHEDDVTEETQAHSRGCVSLMRDIAPLVDSLSDALRIDNTLD